MPDRRQKADKALAMARRYHAGAAELLRKAQAEPLSPQAPEWLRKAHACTLNGMRLSKAAHKLQGREGLSTRRIAQAAQKAPVADKGEPMITDLFVRFGSLVAGALEERLAIVKAMAEGRSHRYIRRVPTGNPKRPWRYYYTEAALARDAQEGEQVKVGERHVEVTGADAEHVRIRDEEGTERTFTREQWTEHLFAHAGEAFHRAAERKARSWAKAVLAHVPADMLGDTKAVDELKERAPAIYDKLAAAFSKAGINADTARHFVAHTLARRGWSGEARAALFGGSLADAAVIASYRQIGDAAERLAATRVKGQGTSTVEAVDVGKAIELHRAPVDRKAARAQVDNVTKLVADAAKANTPEAAHAVLAALLASPEVARLRELAAAYPGAISDELVRRAVDVGTEAQAAKPRAAPVREGGTANVYVAGEDGKPVALRARFRLVEAGDVTPSHNPLTFAPHEAYPQGVQERAYHRDKAEQVKVARNADKLDPAFVANTNPDAVNGPPVVDPEGIVLGGNSRTMSMQRAYAEHPESAERLKKYLAEHAHEFGLRREDVEALERPMLVRQVETDTSLEARRVLVRQMNESFMQAMDPRTMAVAMGRKMPEEVISTLGSTMAEDETLSEFLDTKRSGTFVDGLRRAGLIDRRNESYYTVKGDPTRLNEYGKSLVEQVLVGRVIDNADVLAETRPSIVSALARATPYILQAEAGGKGYDVRSDLRTALDAYNDMARLGVLPTTKDTAKGDAWVESKVREAKAHLDDLFTGKHPVIGNRRAEAMLDVLIRRSGPVQMAAIFREYAKQAKANPEGQSTMFGAASPSEVFDQAVRAAVDRDARAAAEAQRAQSRGGDLFARGFFARLSDGLSWRY